MAKEDERLLKGKEIGDNLDLEIEATYPCSDGSITSTISVVKLLKAQLAKADSIIRAEGFRDGVKATMDWAVKHHYVTDYDLDKFVGTLKREKIG